MTTRLPILSRYSICVALAASCGFGAVSDSTMRAHAADAKAKTSKSWTIEICPRNGERRFETVDEKGPSARESAKQSRQAKKAAPTKGASRQRKSANQQVESSLRVSPSQYREIYRSIPFVRSEFLANPSYRHDATMEILFGEMRQTIVYRSLPPLVPGLPYSLVSYPRLR